MMDKLKIRDEIQVTKRMRVLQIVIWIVWGVDLCLYLLFKSDGLMIAGKIVVGGVGAMCINQHITGGGTSVSVFPVPPLSEDSSPSNKRRRLVALGQGIFFYCISLFFMR